MIPLKLSEVKPDFSSILLQLQLYLQNTDTWADLQTSGTGQTLLELMSAIGAFNQFAIESAARETTLTTAARDSSIYAITRMLGVRIHRKSPAGVDVSLARKDSSASMMIPRFTQFNVNGKPFFNRDALMFAQGSTAASQRIYYGPVKEVLSQTKFRLFTELLNVQQLRYGDTFQLLVNTGADSGSTKRIVYRGGNVGEDEFELAAGETAFTRLNLESRVSILEEQVRLYEGSITEERFDSDGSAFKQLYMTEGSFKISDIDVEVFVLNEAQGTIETWGNIEDGIWIAGNTDKVFYDSTSGMGETILAFGDGMHGVVPPLGSTILVKYAVTSGAAANKGLTNLSVDCPTLSDLSGVTTSVISGGADEKPASYYRFLAPMIFKANNRAVTDGDYQAIALDYPGIVSASVQAQRDIAPGDLRWMNQVRVCLLPSDESTFALTASEWDEFFEYMKRKRHAAVNVIHINPTRMLADVSITLALKSQYTPSSVLPRAEASVRALFSRRPDTLGRRIAVSDVVKAAIVEGVDYVEVDECKFISSTVAVHDLLPVDDTHFVALNEYSVNTKYSERSIYSDGSSV